MPRSASDVMAWLGSIVAMYVTYWLLGPYIGNPFLRGFAAAALVVAIALVAITAFYAYRKP